MGRYQTKKGRIFESELQKYMTLAGWSKETLREHTSIGSNVTMLKYFDDPETIPIGRMAEIMSALKIPRDERMRIIQKLIDD